MELLLLLVVPLEHSGHCAWPFEGLSMSSSAILGLLTFLQLLIPSPLVFQQVPRRLGKVHVYKNHNVKS